MLLAHLLSLFLVSTSDDPEVNMISTLSHTTTLERHLKKRGHVRVSAVVHDHSALFPVALRPPTPDNDLDHVGGPLLTPEDRHGTFLGPPWFSLGPP